MIEVPGPRDLAADEVLIQVRTAGVANWDGFVRTGGASTQGTGLVGLSDRLAALSGRLSVASAPGEGTTLNAVIPL